jgi:hypothetical protein
LTVRPAYEWAYFEDAAGGAGVLVMVSRAGRGVYWLQFDCVLCALKCMPLAYDWDRGALRGDSAPHGVSTPQG